MIELKVSGKCLGCPAMDLTILDLQSDGNRIQHVRCKNEIVCEFLEEKIKKEMNSFL